MKLGKFKNEQELMDSIRPGKDGKLRKTDLKKLTDYIVDLNEKFNVSVDDAAEYVKYMLELKKLGEPIETVYLDENAVDYKKPLAMVPRERTRSEFAGQYTERELNGLIGQELYYAISLYHSIEDKRTREFYVKDTFEWFCEHYGADKTSTVELLKSYFRDRHKKTNFNYNKFLGRKLNDIVGVEPDPDFRKYDRIRTNVQYEKDERTTDDEQK